VAAKLSILRAKTTTPEEFRHNVRELSILLLTKLRGLGQTSPIELETPLTKCAGQIPVQADCARADSARGSGHVRRNAAPRAGCEVWATLGFYRDEETLRPVTYFSRLPTNLSEAQVVLVDPMLATGNSACEAVAVVESARCKAHSISLSGRMSAGHRAIAIDASRRVDFHRRY